VIKQLLIVVGAAASIAALIAVATWPGEAQQRAAYILEKSTPPVFDSSYTAGLRIIHVPEAAHVPEVRTPPAPPARAAAPSYREEADIDVAPAPQRKSVAAPHPRRILPPAGTTKRTMLDAPSSMHDGPSPVRPLPRWREIEKFTELPKPVNAAPEAAAPIPAAPAAVIEADAPLTDGQPQK
jgi:hypothetical protein